MKKIYYEGESKALKRMAELLNRKPEMGEGHEDAYYGDYSKEAYEHSQIRSGNPHNVTLADLGLEGIVEKVNALILALELQRGWITHEEEAVTDHSGTPICFHGFGMDRNYLLWH